MDLRTLPTFLTLFTIYDIGRPPTQEITFIPHLRWQKMVENFKSTIRCRLSANVVTLSLPSRGGAGKGMMTTEQVTGTHASGRNTVSRVRGKNGAPGDLVCKLLP